MRINKHISFIMRCIKLNLAALAVTALCYALVSFKTTKFNDDALAIIGLNPSQANEKIDNSIASGTLYTWGVKNVRGIAVSERPGVAMDLLVYTKKYVSAADYAKSYATMRENFKPQLSPEPEKPADYRKKLIDQAQKVVDDAQKYYDNATPENKSTFKSSLDESKKYLEDIKNPENELVKFYADNYELTLDTYKKDSVEKIQTWQETYPENALLFVKKRLEEFMTVTANINFNAATVERNGKTYFADKEYESKDKRWKMAYRAGKDVVQTARTFVQQWIAEIK